jgi:hypothetical protein
MSAIDMKELSASFDSAALQLLGQLRTSKTLDDRALAKVSSLIEGIGKAVEAQAEVPKDLVGKLWFVFTAMLAEAEHARANREQIEIAAWGIQEKLRKIFGPQFS